MLIPRHTAFTGLLCRSSFRTTTNSSLAPLSSTKIVKVLTDKPKPKLPNDKLVFGQTFTDHMLVVEWDSDKGWHSPEIKPYGKISLDPSATVFHYALECFEGMKAYKDASGKIRLFRPNMNMLRLNKSCERVTLPTFDGDELLSCIKEFLKVETDWIPADRGYSLYLRPTCIATQESLGVGPSNKALMFVIASPVGPYYKTGFNPVSLYATQDFVRAWPGGSGDTKIGANYAPGIRPQIHVAKEGYQQNLWVFGEDESLTEVGTMNFFMFWTNEKGERELVTPPLDGTILPGITRDSIIHLARSWNEFKVVERKITLPTVVKALNEGRVHEMFGSGTAAIVSPIKCIHYKGKDLQIPIDPKLNAGQLTKRISEAVMKIQYGECQGKEAEKWGVQDWSVVVD
ncbi:aminotransferase [Gaertneriomyces semiglobifer]|nr:aminotransferase [Gaertneriomyces semiglobifer]